MTVPCDLPYAGSKEPTRPNKNKLTDTEQINGTRRKWVELERADSEGDQ